MNILIRRLTFSLVAGAEIGDRRLRFGESDSCVGECMCFRIVMMLKNCVFIRTSSSPNVNTC